MIGRTIKFTDKDDEKCIGIVEDTIIKGGSTAYLVTLIEDEELTYAVLVYPEEVIKVKQEKKV